MNVNEKNLHMNKKLRMQMLKLLNANYLILLQKKPYTSRRMLTIPIRDYR